MKKNKHQPKISVIIPIYNAEKHLRTCLDSAINQTFTDVEIICVNDGSTDDSPHILQEYAAKDSRIKVMHQENSGVSVARNNGLSMATGEYVSFMDSDDYLAPQTFEHTLSILKENTDILLFGSFLAKENKNTKMWDNELLQNFEQNKYSTEFSTLLVRVFSNVWAKLYRRDFLLAKNIVFPPKIKTAEDAIFNIIALLNNPKYQFCSECLYYYRISPTQTTKDRQKCIISDVEAFKYLENIPLFQNASQQAKLVIIEKFINGILLHSAHLPQHYASVVDDFIAYLSQKYEKEDIAKLLHNKKYKFSFWERLFCAYDSPTGKYRIYQIFGIKLKIRKK